MSRFKSAFLLSLFACILLVSCSDDDINQPMDNDPDDMPMMDTMTMGMDTMTMGMDTMTMGMDTMTMGMDTMTMGMDTNTMGMDTMTMGMDSMTLSMDATIWTGEELTFVLADNVDFRAPGNQDTITSDVIITRSPGGGQIFNLALEGMVDGTISPAGTAWAVGRTDDLDNLTFAPLRETVVRLQDIVGMELVMQLVEDNIFLNVTFTAWTVGRNSGGGFAYSRATPNE